MFVLLNLGHNQMLRWQGIVGGGIRGIYREGEGRKLQHKNFRVIYSIIAVYILCRSQELGPLYCMVTRWKVSCKWEQDWRTYLLGPTNWKVIRQSTNCKIFNLEYQFLLKSLFCFFLLILHIMPNFQVQTFKDSNKDLQKLEALNTEQSNVVMKIESSSGHWAMQQGQHLFRYKNYTTLLNTD